MTDQANRRSRLQLVLIMAIALVSLGGAYFVFYMAKQGAMWGTTNKGTFVDPPQTMAALDIRDGRGRELMETGTWWLWVVPQGPCSDACREALHQLRQLHVLLNRDAPRVRRALVTGQPAGSDALAQEYPKLEFLTGDLTPLAPGVYIVDPLGNLVFRYTLGEAGEPVLDDLKRLLKVSQIG